MVALAFSVVWKYACFSVVVPVTRLSLRQLSVFSKLDSGCPQESLWWSDPLLTALLAWTEFVLGYLQYSSGTVQTTTLQQLRCLIPSRCFSAVVVPQVLTWKHASLERVILAFKNAFPSNPIRHLSNVFRATFTTAESILMQQEGLGKKGNVERWEEQESGAYSWLHHHAEHGSPYSISSVQCEM